MHEVPLLDPGQTETIFDGALPPPVQRHGDTVSGDVLDNEIDNAWPSPMFSPVNILEAGNRIPHMPDDNREEEGKSPGHM